MGITSDKNSQPPKEEEEDEGRSYLGDLPEIIEDCIELFGEDDPLTQQYRQELIDLTQEKQRREKQRREKNPSHYKEEEDEWHAGMVPNLRPKSEKGLEEDSEDEEDGPAEEADGPALNPEAPKAEPDLSPMSKAGGDGK
ncbi:MAG: hypothetical protein NT142_17300 [Planctomycetota bacterium]|nr:hypothetical protein [Planctomycetota bacterium]